MTNKSTQRQWKTRAEISAAPYSTLSTSWPRPLPCRGKGLSLGVTFRSCLLRERFAEHRIPALGLLTRSLVLNDIPVFAENPILQANDVRCDPVHRQSYVGEPAMNDDVVTFYKNDPGLILERRRRGLDEVEEPVSSRLDMGAVLNVVGRPEPLRRRVVSFIEEGIECLQYDRLVLLRI